MVPVATLATNLRRGRAMVNFLDLKTTFLAKHPSVVNFSFFWRVADQTTQQGFNKAFLVRDSDGHVIEIEKK
jgi:hypothetical protein